MDSQRESIVMTQVEQAAIPFRIRAHERTDDMDLFTFEKVMDRIIGGHFVNDKEAADKLKIDPGLLSKRKSGQAPWTISDMRSLMERCETVLPLAWLAKQYGYALVMMETEAERQLRELQDQLKQEREERRIEQQLMRRIVVGQMQPTA